MDDSLAYLADQYARNAEAALLGADGAVACCRRYSDLHWLVAQLPESHG